MGEDLEEKDYAFIKLALLANGSKRAVAIANKIKLEKKQAFKRKGKLTYLEEKL